MAEMSLSEAKYLIEDNLMSALGVSAGKFIGPISDAGDKAALGAIVLATAAALERGSEPQAGKALKAQWMLIKNKL